MTRDSDNTQVTLGLSLEVVGNVVERWLNTKVVKENTRVTGVSANNVVGQWQYRFILLSDVLGGTLVLEAPALVEVFVWAFDGFYLTDAMPAPCVLKVEHANQVPLLAGHVPDAAVFVTLASSHGGDDES